LAIAAATSDPNEATVLMNMEINEPSLDHATAVAVATILAGRLVMLAQVMATNDLMADGFEFGDHVPDEARPRLDERTKFYVQTAFDQLDEMLGGGPTS
jgi:hypothetical protein